jgi:GNAT superfamily N-acetyltransferase
LRNVERLEKFWHNLVLTLPWVIDMNGAVVIHCPEMPVPLFNNATSINVNEDEAENLLNKVINYFSSRGFPFACFRISPLTHPRSFTSLLECYGFERKPEHEQSVMVFKEKPLEDKLNPAVKVEEISKDEIDLFDRLLIRSFKMSIEWKEVFNKINLEWMRKGAKHYLAYVEGKTVGTTTLISLMKTGGIFSVGTLKEYRRRGVGTTLTVHALMDSINEGNDLHTLQATKGGDAERLYQKIGFKIDHTISYFVKDFKKKS